MKQTDLIEHIRKNENRDFDRLDTQYVFRDGRRRKMIAIKVRSTGPHRARSVAWQLNRQLAAKLNRCQRTEHFIMQIGTSSDHPLLMREQMEIDSILTSGSPLKKRWREARFYEVTRLRQELEIAVVLWIVPHHSVSNQLSYKA